MASRDIVRFVGRAVFRSATRNTRRRGRSLRYHTMYAIRHPIRTLLQSVFGLAIFGVIYLVAYKGAETSALLAQESVGPLEVLGLFPPLPLLVPIVVVAVVFITVASILGNARRDAEFGRWR